MNSLSDKAMLVKLSISQWTARKYDRTVTDKVKSDYNTSGDVGQWNKHLVAKQYIDAIAKAARRAYDCHKKNTLPWLDEGTRILLSENFFQFSAEIQKCHEEFDEAVASYLRINADGTSHYTTSKEEARARLNGMFNEDDYPENIQAKYDFDIAILPLMNPNDFRVKINDEEVTEIQKDIQRRLEQATETAMKDLWQRLYEVVSHIEGRLSDKEATFRDSLIQNAQELVELLPRLNITGDADLENMRKEVKDKLLTYDADTLRISDSARATTANSAHDILDRIKSRI